MTSRDRGKVHPGCFGMRVFSSNQEIQAALTRLAEYLLLAGAPRTTLLVGGGSALAVLGLITRTTKDVDIIAVVSSESRGSFVSAKPLPDYFLEARRKVAEDLGLAEDWINPGPTSLLDFGLPSGCLDRSLRVEYGEALTVHFIDRKDQIFLKLYAAVDQGGRHLTDLISLRPSSDELLEAGRWAMTHDPSLGFRALLIDLLTQLGFDYVASDL